MKPRHLTIVLTMLLSLMGCETIDCTLENTVACRYGLYTTEGSVKLNDTLSIYVCSSNDVLLNQETEASGAVLPMSYWQDIDTLLFVVAGERYIIEDTVFIEKVNTPHFESPDCPSKMFHEITSVRCSHNYMDSIVLVQPLVNYNEIENIRIYLRAGK